MNFKTTLFLLVLVALVGSYLLFFERRQPTTIERQQALNDAGKLPGTPLFRPDQLSTDAIQAVTIERDGKKISLKRDGEEWSQVEPVKFALNRWSVQQLIDSAASLRYNQKLQPGEKNVPSLEKLGLAQPLAIVMLQAAGSQPAAHTLKVGRTTVGGQGFVQMDADAAVYVVGDALHHLLQDQKVESWRKRTLAAPKEGQAGEITLTHGPSRISLIKADGNWFLGPPQSGRADAKAIGAILSQLGAMYIDKFVADAPADLSLYGLDKPTTTLTIKIPASPAVSQPADQSAAAKMAVQSLRIGSPVDLSKEAYFATWVEGDEPGQVIFTLGKADVERFAKSADDLRDARITPLAATDVREVSLERSGLTPLKLQRGSAGWAFAEPGPGFSADNDEVSKLVAAIVETKARGFIADAKPANPPLATITLSAVGRSEPDVLRVYSAEKDKEGKERRLVVRNNETTGYVVPGEQLSALTATALSLRDREIFKLDPTQITKVVIRHPDVTYAFERTAAPAGSQPATQAAEPGPWKLTGQPRFEAQAFEKFLAALASLRAASWVKPLDVPATYPWAPGLWIEVSMADGKSHPLTIDNNSGLGWAQADDLPWFELDRSFIALAGAEFRDRTVLPIAAMEIRSISVTRGGKTIVIHRNPDGKYVGGDEQAVNQAAAGGLFDTLAGLRVERHLSVVKAGKPRMQILIETQAGQKITLAFPASDGEPESAAMSGALGEKFFRVSKDVMKKFEADLTGREEFKKELPLEGD